MANIKSQIKRIRQSQRRHDRNQGERTRLKSEAKKVRSAADAGNREAAEEQFRRAARMLDKAASKGIVHKRTAARRKSRLARKLARSS